MLFMMLMLGTVSAVMAQGADVPATDYDAMIGTFAGFVGGVVVLTEGLKGLFPNMKGWVTQLVSWCVGLVCAMLKWIIPRLCLKRNIRHLPIISFARTLVVITKAMPLPVSFMVM